MAEHLTFIVRAATAADAGVPWLGALTCSRSPDRRRCQGHLSMLRMDVPPSIEWRCISCGDCGVISGWERSPFDLRPRSIDPRPTEAFQLVIPAEVAATLRGLMLLDSASERLVFRAGVDDGDVVLTGDDDDFEELIGSVAAEANHEQNRRRQKQLDAAFEALNDALMR